MWVMVAMSICRAGWAVNFYTTPGPLLGGVPGADRRLDATRRGNEPTKPAALWAVLTCAGSIECLDNVGRPGPFGFGGNGGRRRGA